jgi:hypothetical protein
MRKKTTKGDTTSARDKEKEAKYTKRKSKREEHGGQTGGREKGK